MTGSTKRGSREGGLRRHLWGDRQAETGPTDPGRRHNSKLGVTKNPKRPEQLKMHELRENGQGHVYDAGRARRSRAPPSRQPQVTGNTGHPKQGMAQMRSKWKIRLRFVKAV